VPARTGPDLSGCYRVVGYAKLHPPYRLNLGVTQSMSFSHIKLKKTDENEEYVRYRIYSFDFNKEHKWEQFGIIQIEKKSSSFKHLDNQLWEKNKIYPIDLFEIPVEKRREIVQTKYTKYASGRWAMNVYDFIKKSLETRVFPEERDLIS
jgi:hypothetical protein